MIFPQEPIATEKQYEARLARKRQLEAERRSRIFDPKVRTMGIDVQSLNQQVYERQQSARNEQLEQLTNGQLIMESDRKARLEQSVLAAQRLQECKELEEFRKLAQRRELRREYDLYDPQGLAKSQPPRLSDADSNVHVSSLQKFFGEDLEKDERLRTQQTQMKTWVMEQLFEKAEIKNKELEYLRQIEAEKSLFDKLVEASSKHVSEMKFSERAAAEFNRQLAKELASKRDKIENEQYSAQEYSLSVQEAFLQRLRLNLPITESEINAIYIPDSPYDRGMRTEDVAKILHYQYLQRMQQHARSEKLKQDKVEENVQYANMAKMTELDARARAREQRAKQLAFQRDNLALSKQIKSTREGYELSEKMNNGVQDSFFAQFNTSSR